MDINYFLENWQKESPDLAGTEKFWDLRAEEFNNHPGNKENEKRLEETMHFLTSRDMLHEQAEILDIGCGPGKYALAFAKRGKRVVGIDISPHMLRCAWENAAKQRCDNFVFEKTAWETVNLAEYGWQRKFDLVFAGMCPAISSGDSLLKMCRASKGYCFVSSFAQRKDELRDELYRAIHGKQLARRWGRNIYFMLNVLLLSGYHPEVTYRDVEFEHRWPMEKAAEIYSRQLQDQNTAGQDISK
ncbi:MAG TPA: class I SAM-dependent methyltransferase, partial [Firmicutes bacterium]|nr:class I SAM-dependent methyltransferase [Bacillota bacterium]